MYPYLSISRNLFRRSVLGAHPSPGGLTSLIFRDAIAKALFIYIYVDESPINVLGLMEVFACAQCVQINFKQVQFFLDVDGAFKCSHGAVSEEAQAEIARSFFITHFDFSAEVGTLCTYKQEVERLSAELTDTLSKNSELESALHDNAERLHALQNQIGETCAKNRNLTSQLNSRLEENRKFIDLKTELEQLKVKFSDLNVNFNSEVVQHCEMKFKSGVSIWMN